MTNTKQTQTKALVGTRLVVVQQLHSERIRTQHYLNINLKNEITRVEHKLKYNLFQFIVPNNNNNKKTVQSINEPFKWHGQGWGRASIQTGHEKYRRSECITT